MYQLSCTEFLQRSCIKTEEQKSLTLFIYWEYTVHKEELQILTLIQKN